jgi:hypothetical protein
MPTNRMSSLLVLIQTWILKFKIKEKDVYIGVRWVQHILLIPTQSKTLTLHLLDDIDLWHGDLVYIADTKYHYEHVCLKKISCYFKIHLCTEKLCHEQVCTHTQINTDQTFWQLLGSSAQSGSTRYPLTTKHNTLKHNHSTVQNIKCWCFYLTLDHLFKCWYKYKAKMVMA